MFHVIEFDSPVKGSNDHAYLELVVTSFTCVDGDHRADNRDDFMGYVEIEWECYTYYIEDEDGKEVDCGEGEPPVQLTVSYGAIEDYLINILCDDKDALGDEL